MFVLTVADFRVKFPEFSDSDIYADALIQFCIDDAVYVTDKMVGVTSENDIQQLGLYLTAHYVFCKKYPQYGDMTNRNPVISTGLGDSSTGYQGKDGMSMLEIDFNASNYGQKYLSYLRLWRINAIGAGLIVNG
jgi:hypothetical protein